MHSAYGHPEPHTSIVLRLIVVVVLVFGPCVRSTDAADQINFSAVENVTNLIIQRIGNETGRLDISAWYLTEHSISVAIANRWALGVPVRLIGDRSAIFDIDQSTRNEFFWLA